MRALVIGYGSIGSRHIRLLQSLNIETAVVSKRVVDFPTVYNELSDALGSFQPDYIVIANKTSEHYSTLSQLAKWKWKGSILVEKPLFHQISELSDPDDNLQLAVAYNLRFHPIISHLKDILENERLLSVTAYAGQYLPEWRPERDYRLSYSSNKEEGGGVLRDLSHELDYLNWLCGPWVRLTGLGGHFSSLDTTADDFCGVLFETKMCPIVSLQVNYMDRPGRREIIIVTDLHTYKVNLNLSILEKDGQVEAYPVDRDTTYTLQHKAVINNDWKRLCTFDEGNEVVRMIDAIEQSILHKEWVWNG